MKNLILKTLVTMSLATPALAQNNPVINERNFGGEVYDLSKDIRIDKEIRIISQLTSINNEWLAFYQSPNGLIDVKFYMTIITEDVTFEDGSWYESKVPSRFLKCESGLLHNSCVADFAAIRKFLHDRYIDSSTARGEFLGLDDTGKKLILRNHHSSDLFNNFLPSNSETFEVVYTFSFDSCRDEMGRIITLNNGAKADSIENMVKTLRATNFDKIKLCTLTSPNPTWTTENFKVKDFDRPVRMVINSEERFFAEIPNRYNVNKLWFTKQKDKQTDPAKRQQAIHALQVFTKWVKEVYTDHLLNIHYQNLDTLKIGLANEAFFNKNKNQLQDMLNDIQQNFAHLSLMEKIGWLRLLNISFDSIRTVEEQLKTPMNVNLDRVVRSYNN